MRVWIDKIASSTGNVTLRRDARVSRDVIAREGQIVIGRIRGVKTAYNQLEDLHGRMVALHDGDVIAGVLGHRNALHGYSGYVPERVQSGDVLQVLNLGGVIGKCTSQNPEVGRPFDIEILGGALVFPDFENRSGVPAHISMNAIPLIETPTEIPDIPIVCIVGTCMNSGKTTAACQLVRQLAKTGRTVGACKLTGVSLRRDVLQMLDYGAQFSVSFTEAGIVSTTAENSVPIARSLFTHLAHAGADVIVAELGDGILGEYGVGEILADRQLMKRAAVIVLCANDPVGTWGADQLLRDRFGLKIDMVTGPTTDNAVGTRYVTERLKLPAVNARTHSNDFGEQIVERLETGIAQECK